MQASPGYVGKSILGFVSDPESVADWSPVIQQATQESESGEILYFPGPRHYRLGSPVSLEKGQVFLFHASAVLTAKEIDSLFVIKGEGRYRFEGIGGKARLELNGSQGSVIDLCAIPEGVVPDLELISVHLVGYRGINGLVSRETGRRYIEERGSLGEFTVLDSTIEASDIGIGHQRGEVGSLRVENTLFCGEPRMGLYISSPITGGAMVKGNKFLDIGIRALQLGGGKANMIDEGAVNHLPVVNVHDNQVIGGGKQAGENASYIMGILVYGNSISIQGNIVRDFNRGEPVPGERVGHHFKMQDGSWHRGPWVSEDGSPRRRLAGAAIYAKARHGIIANNVCTNSGWRAVIEVKTGGREPYFLVANNVVDGRSLSIEDSFGFEPNVAKAMWVNNLVYNMPNMAFKVSNRMQSAYINNVIHDSKIGFVVHDNTHEYPELIANNHFVNVETPVQGLPSTKFTAAVTPPMPIMVESERALPVPAEQDRGRMAVILDEQGDRLAMVRREGNDYGWVSLDGEWLTRISTVPVQWETVGSNLLTNPNLDQLDTEAVRKGGRQTRFKGWSFSSSIDRSVEEMGVGLRSSPEYPGRELWSAGGENTPEFNWVMQQSLRLAPGTSWRARARVWRSDRRNALTLIMDDGRNGVSKSMATTAVGEWQDLEVIFTVPEDLQSTPRVRLHSSRCGNGREIRVESVVVEEVTTIQGE